MATLNGGSGATLGGYPVHSWTLDSRAIGAYGSVDRTLRADIYWFEGAPEALLGNHSIDFVVGDQRATVLPIDVEVTHFPDAIMQMTVKAVVQGDPMPSAPPVVSVPARAVTRRRRAISFGGI